MAACGARSALQRASRQRHRCLRPRRARTAAIAERPESPPPGRKAKDQVGNLGLPARGEGFIEAKVEAAALTPSGPAVFLELLDGSGRVLPVFIGDNEYNAFMEAMKRLRPPRPNTYDLMVETLREMGRNVSHARVTHIEGAAMVGRVYYAESDGEPICDVDSRPSDACNLALRFGAPIYVAHQVAAVRAVEVGGKGWQAAVPQPSTPQKKPPPAAPPAEPLVPPQRPDLLDGNWGPPKSPARHDYSAWLEVAADLPPPPPPPIRVEQRARLAVALAAGRWEDARAARAAMATGTDGRTYRALLEGDLEAAAAAGDYTLAARLRDELVKLLGDGPPPDESECGYSI
jgi:hypothetical protein